MDQETAQALFDQGAFLLFLNAPEGMEFGIDFNSWKIGPKFKGMKLIPPGLHFVFYSTSNKFGTSGLKTGFFKFYESKELVIKYWDHTLEDFKNESDSEQVERLNSDIRQFDPFLGPYPFSPPTNWQKWIHLTSLITSRLISVILPNEGRVANISSSTVDEEELLKLNDLKYQENDTIFFTKFDLRKSWRPGATGQEVTKYSQDKSWLLSELLNKVYNNDYKELLGELQLAFVCFLIAENYAGFIQWKNLVQLICSCQEELEKYADTLFTDFLDVLKCQLEECPRDFFHNIVTEDNYLAHVLKNFRRNILEASSMDAIPQQSLEKLHTLRRRFEKFRGFLNQRFHWEIVDEVAAREEEEREEGEYAPVVVELPDTE
ncbi:A1 cistron-splicing factor [Glomus cerebriforme]|uniref:A1 cistron-splicing factor n=1 Tax=Glomus cerebriforme TaxID=658196 RepID=A0A397TMF8_9GLOM|nr:A1 cistron-splicing factor [Glomus cerebriforme]